LDNKSQLDLSPTAIEVLEKRYLQKNDDGIVIETPYDLFKRVAEAIAESHEQTQEFLKLLINQKFMPNSPTLMNAGTKLGQLSACFVLPIEDSLEGIYKTLTDAAMIHKSGGGTGFSFNRLRPRGSIIKSSKGHSPGPVSFLRIFNASTNEITQGGKRRGANMGILNYNHPDIFEWIYIKRTEGSIANFNLSVALDKNFFDALEKDDYFELCDPRPGQTYTIKTFRNAQKVGSIAPILTESKDKIINRTTKESVGKIENDKILIKAKALFEEIVEGAWQNGEPGVIFLDKINRWNPTPEVGDIESTNPCGEQPLLPYESCNLGSINLAKFVKDGKIDWDELERVVRASVRFLDNVIDKNKYPLPEIAQNTKANRKIGLGIMGWADMLALLGLAYDSQEAVELAEVIMEFIQYISKDESVELAKQKGKFPNFDKSVFAKGKDWLIKNWFINSAPESAIEKWNRPKLDWTALAEKIEKFGIRNATTTTIAPTGSISLIADCSSGIEPYFAVQYYKHTKLEGRGVTIVVKNKYFEQKLREHGIAYTKELEEKINANRGSPSKIKELPEQIRSSFKTFLDVPPEWHVKMQAAFQKYTDNAVSKTINLPNSASRDDVRKVFLLAYKLGCKGLTVYRDGSRMEQAITVEKKKEKKDEPKELPKSRPDALVGLTFRVPVGCGRLFVTLNVDPARKYAPREIFINAGKFGICLGSQTQSLARVISQGLKHGVPPTTYIEHLKGIRCNNPWSEGYVGGAVVHSCSDAVAAVFEWYEQFRTKDGYNFKKAIDMLSENKFRDFLRMRGWPKFMKKIIEEKEEKKKDEKKDTIQLKLNGGGKYGACPYCGGELIYQEGCIRCTSCDYNKCGS